MNVKYYLGLIRVPFLRHEVENFNVFVSHLRVSFCELSTHFHNFLKWSDGLCYAVYEDRYQPTVAAGLLACGWRD